MSSLVILGFLFLLSTKNGGHENFSMRKCHASRARDHTLVYALETLKREWLKIESLGRASPAFRDGSSRVTFFFFFSHSSLFITISYLIDAPSINLLTGKFERTHPLKNIYFFFLQTRIEKYKYRLMGKIILGIINRLDPPPFAYYYRFPLMAKKERLRIYIYIYKPVIKISRKG